MAIVSNCCLEDGAFAPQIKLKRKRDRKIKTDQLEILLNVSTNDNFNLLKDVALIGNKIKTNKLLSDTVIETEKIIFLEASILD